MSKAIEILQSALTQAQADRPVKGGFAYLAESLRQAGVTNNVWHLPSCQSTYITKEGPVAHVHEPLFQGSVDIPKFSRELLIDALKTDKAGESTFPEFLMASWNAGVIRYEINFGARRVTYYGCKGEEYEEDYSKVWLKGANHNN